MVKYLILLAFLSFGASAHTVTVDDYIKCVGEDRLALLFSIEDAKEAGVSKKDLVAALNPQLPKAVRDQVLKDINFAYDIKHKVNAPTSAFVECLSK